MQTSSNGTELQTANATIGMAEEDNVAISSAGFSTYEYAFIVSLIFTTLITLKARQGSDKGVRSSHFVRFQWVYLVVYYASMFGDWLQGPYVYALYDAYGFKKEDIATLFVAGFGSSMVFGTFIGSLADQMGRKRFVILYCVLYVASCITKHFNSYKVLMVGRLLGGIATSLLFSVFDSWLVAEHNLRNFPEKDLGSTFSMAYFGNSIVAILSGLIGEKVAQFHPMAPVANSTTVDQDDAVANSTTTFHYGGFISPFDLAILFLVVAGLLTCCLWSENYGQRDFNAAGLSLSAMGGAMKEIKNNNKVLLIGLMSSLFESSMYTFVFLWTPILTDVDGKGIPFGTIFAVFMLSCMGGSSMFKLLSSSYQSEQLTQVMFVVAALSLLVPVFVPSAPVIIGCFMIFEVCVGLYWPAMGTLKGMIVPEASRSAIYNIFRVPLNLMVLGVLCFNLSTPTAFMCCAIALVIGGALNTLLVKALEADRLSQARRSWILMKLRTRWTRIGEKVKGKHKLQQTQR
eukprot:g56531.t1